MYNDVAPFTTALARSVPISSYSYIQAITCILETDPPRGFSAKTCIYLFHIVSINIESSSQLHWSPNQENLTPKISCWWSVGTLAVLLTIVELMPIPNWPWTTVPKFSPKSYPAVGLMFTFSVLGLRVHHFWKKVVLYSEHWGKQ